MSFTDGPKVTIEASCSSCRYVVEEDYCYEDGNDVDSGQRVYCSHPDTKDQSGVHLPQMRIGDTTWKTPAWCPLLAARVAEILSTVKP